MKVAHLVIGSDVAGGELVALRLLEGARDAGWETVLFLPREGRLAETARARDLEVRVVPLGRAADVRNPARVRAALHAEGVSLLHTHALLAGNLAGRVGARIAGKPVISHAHALEHYRAGAAARPQRALDSWSARLCAAIVAVSAETRDALVASGYPAERVVVVENGVDLTPSTRPRDEVRAELGLPAQATVAVSIGRLSPAKGQRELIEALPSCPDVHALIVGVDIEDGGYERELERLAHELDVEDRVCFGGFRSDVPDLIAASDVLVLASHQEALPLVVLEAMAQGRPVIATRVGAVPGLLGPTGAGILVDVADAAGLAAALRQVHDEPSRAREMGRAGEREAARHDARTMVERVLALYDEVVSRTLSGP